MSDSINWSTTTEQEVYDFVARKLIEQGRPSAHEVEHELANGDKRTTVDCMYRLDGCKCAAGWMLPDDQYDPEIESKSIYNLLINRNPALPNGMADWTFSARSAEDTTNHENFIRALQRAHDNAANLSSKLADPATWLVRFKDQMIWVARDFKLDPSVLGFGQDPEPYQYFV